jgi:hypothetical protein
MSHYPAIVELAAEDVDQVINGTSALEHQLLKFFESYFSHCLPVSDRCCFVVFPPWRHFGDIGPQR